MEIGNLATYSCGRGLVQHFALIFIEPGDEERVSEIGSLLNALV